jgi:hypothetical protein
LPNEGTEDKLNSVIKHLRSGKSPKEIAVLLSAQKKITHGGVLKIVQRHVEVRQVYEQTRPIRNLGPDHYIAVKREQRASMG